MTRRAIALVFWAALLAAAACGPYGPDRTVSSADGVSIAYHIEGEGDPALVFIHGWSCDRSYWRYQAQHFAKTHTVVTIDLAGHGASGGGRSSWSIPAFGADVAAVINEEDLSKVILIGHSMGGEVSLEAARACADKILGIVGVDTFQDFNDVYTKEQAEQFVAPFRTDFRAAADPFVRAMFAWGADPLLVDRTAKAMSSAPQAVAVASLEALCAYRPAEALKSIRLPIRCINSDKIATNVPGNRRLAPAFDVRIMPGLGHFLQLEDPSTFNRLLDETIADIVAGR